MNKILETLKQIDKNFECDDLGMGYGIRSTEGNFIRIKPFWLSDEEIENGLPPRQDFNQPAE